MFATTESWELFFAASVFLCLSFIHSFIHFGEVSFRLSFISSRLYKRFFAGSNCQTHNVQTCFSLYYLASSLLSHLQYSSYFFLFAFHFPSVTCHDWWLNDDESFFLFCFVFPPNDDIKTFRFLLLTEWNLSMKNVAFHWLTKALCCCMGTKCNNWMMNGRASSWREWENWKILKAFWQFTETVECQSTKRNTSRTFLI